MVAGGAAYETDGGHDQVLYENPTSIEEKNLTFNMEQKVEGTGFYAGYRYILMPDAVGPEGRLYNGAEAKNDAHGSGNLDADSWVYAESTYLNRTWINGAYNETGYIIQDQEDTTSAILMQEESNAVYSPAAISIGLWYYHSHPLTFNSLLGERAWIKGRDGFNSIQHAVRDARGLRKALNIESDSYNVSMRLEEDLISGRAHLGALQLAGYPRDEETMVEESEEEGSEEDGSGSAVLGAAMRLWHDPLFVLDEDYAGTYHIKKNISLYVYWDNNAREDDWLPCCTGGYASMTPADQRYVKFAKGIFDCTCFKVPERAQFPRLSQ
jgi:hypothetical protein